ncbi:caspase-8-like [Paramacrobiotus metropolitanus]|uniref:caspase-8-like n=1 Tax=Paramacrobiotus metropolitanus TaxID=2943436 RepID=UPI0024461DD8|nr:caspase-8-like [Paramacrobiotus metropolitanus]
MEYDDGIIEPDAGTPQISQSGSGDGRSVTQTRYPWEKASSSSAQNENDNRTTNLQDRYGDGVDPVNWLAKLTVMLANDNCSRTGVSEELRGILKDEIVVKSLNFPQKFLQRLADLKVISEDFHGELQLMEANSDSLREAFWNYLIRRDLMPVLNFTKALYEDEKYEPVVRIVDFIRKRKLLDGPAKPTPRSSEESVWVTDGADVQVRPGKYQGGSRVYRMASNPRGHVLIINNENFEKSGVFTDRLGTHVDGAKLARLFERLSFKLYQGRQFRDLTRKKMAELVSDFALYEDHQNVDASVVCILSHGDEKGIMGIDGEPITDAQIRSYFTADNCPHLATKPKIFLFVACRGSFIDNGQAVQASLRHGIRSAGMELRSNIDVRADGVTGSGTDFHISSEVKVGNDLVPVMELRHQPPTSKNKIPNNVDFISVYATVPGYRSLRDIDKGTWFVQDFVNVISEEAYLNDFATMVCEVNNRLSERVTRDGEKQSLMVSTTLRRNLFFNPGF